MLYLIRYTFGNNVQLFYKEIQKNMKVVVAFVREHWSTQFYEDAVQKGEGKIAMAKKATTADSKEACLSKKGSSARRSAGVYRRRSTFVCLLKLGFLKKY